jgi:hypothetical protein
MCPKAAKADLDAKRGRPESILPTRVYGFRARRSQPSLRRLRKLACAGATERQSVGWVDAAISRLRWRPPVASVPKLELLRQPDILQTTTIAGRVE